MLIFIYNTESIVGKIILARWLETVKRNIFLHLTIKTTLQ